MSKHTNAPWFVDEEASTDLFRYVMSEGYPNVICKIDRRANKRSEANARLIAAAPELLEALRSALFAIEGLVQQQAMPDKFYEPAAAKARAAIAKAEGA